MDTTCKNCGGDKGLHHWQTMQCPFGGREAPIGQPDQWTVNTFEPATSELAALRAQNAELREALSDTLIVIGNYTGEEIKCDTVSEKKIITAARAILAKHGCDNA